MIDLTVIKPTIIAPLAAYAGVLAMVMAHTDVSVRAGAIGSPQRASKASIKHSNAVGCSRAHGEEMEP